MQRMLQPSPLTMQGMLAPLSVATQHQSMLQSSRAARSTLIVVLLAGALLLGLGASRADALPPGFQEEVVFSGLTNPTAVRFTSDGRVFVAEKSGLIKVFDSLSDTTPTIFADLRTNVHNFWDRGLLGLALHPSFPTQPYVYVLYTYDAAIGGTAPRWGTAGVTSDPCPTPPGPTGDGCVVSGRLSRLQAAGSVMTGPEQVLIEDWCQQYPSHSVGTLAFGADGALYVTGGDGASFNFVDYGQDGSPLNPCGDPPGGSGATLTPPTAEGGALRSQDRRTAGDPVSLDGAVLRVDPATGAAAAGNPLASTDPNERRIIAYGLRNPFRFTIRPGTSEVWLGDVGWNEWEEINRVADPTDSVVENFGWPCYEGSARQSGYDGANLNICENLYGQAGAVTPPFFAYQHSAKVVPGESCPTGGSSIAGVAFGFYSGGPYPASYDGALFFADYSRDCIWAIFKGANNLPDPSAVTTFIAPAANPVDLQISPAGELFYSDFDGGTVRRIRYSSGNQTPRAVAAASPTSGPAPLEVSFSAAGSSDPDTGDTLTYAWDLDGDGAYDDSTSATLKQTYAAGTVTVGLQVTDNHGASDTDTVMISSNNTAPTATITTPTASTTWKVGDVISFSGSASDQQDGTLAASRLSWTLNQQHCPLTCHTHPVQTFAGVASGSFTAPDHEYPSHLALTLTATDSGDLTDTKTVQLDPRTVSLTFQASPSGLQIAVGSSGQATPFTRTVIVGSNNSVSAPSPQTLDGTSYAFSSWSDGGAQTHNITAPATATTYTATFAPSGAGCPTGEYRAEYFANRTLTGSPTFTRCETSIANDWGTGGPGQGVGPDNFSVRWTGTFNLAAGTHLFEARADDGIRLWLDSTLLIDAWRDQSPTRYRGTGSVSAGMHTVKVEYYENGGGAVAEVSRTGCATSQFVAQYYNNRTLAGAPTFTRCDTYPLTFNWGSGGPGTGVAANNFSARWTTRATFAADSYRFTARADDGVRVWVDGVRIIDAWRDQAPTTYTATRTLTAGAHEIRMEYYENAGGAVAQLSWAPG